MCEEDVNKNETCFTKENIKRYDQTLSLLDLRYAS